MTVAANIAVYGTRIGHSANWILEMARDPRKTRVHVHKYEGPLS